MAARPRGEGRGRGRAPGTQTNGADLSPKGMGAESSPGHGEMETGPRIPREARAACRAVPLPAAAERRRPGRAVTPAPPQQSRGGGASRYRRPSPRCPRRGGSRCPGAGARGSAAGAGPVADLAGPDGRAARGRGAAADSARPRQEGAGAPEKP